MDKMTLAGEFLEHLTTDLIPFWSRLEDKEYGGFYGLVDEMGRVDKKAVKGCILNSRILWFFTNCSMLFNELADKDMIPAVKDDKRDPDERKAGYRQLADECLKKAGHAYRFLTEHCLDKEYGGVYWMVGYDGAPADTLKHTYNQAFAIYSLSSYFDATGNREAFDLAMEIADILEERCTDDVGYVEAFNRDFTPARNDELSENGVIADKTMNTLLHVYESYSELLRVAKKHFPVVGEGAVYAKDARAQEKKGYHPENAELAAKLSNRIKFILEIFTEKIYNPKLVRQEVFFDARYNPLIDLHSYGHDIESAWLIDRGLEILADVSLTAEIEPVTLSLAERVYMKAYRDHSLMNECENGRNDTTRVWWVQAEAIVGFMHSSRKYERRAARVLEAMRAAGASAAERHSTQVEAEKMSSRLFAAAVDIWECVKEKFLICNNPGTPDADRAPENTQEQEMGAEAGLRFDRHKHPTEWYENLDDKLNPEPGMNIVRPWKCPYHNGRMCIEMIRRLTGI